MATTLLTELVEDVKASSMIFAGATSDDQIVRYVVMGLRELVSKGLTLVLNDKTAWDEVGIVNPDISAFLHPLRAIIALQAKILALKANPLKQYKITGMDQVFNTDQVGQEEDSLNRMLIDYYADVNPQAFTQTEYDVIGSTDVHLRTLRNVLAPSPIPLFNNPV